MIKNPFGQRSIFILLDREAGAELYYAIKSPSVNAKKVREILATMQCRRFVVSGAWENEPKTEIKEKKSWQISLPMVPPLASSVFVDSDKRGMRLAAG